MREAMLYHDPPEYYSEPKLLSVQLRYLKVGPGPGLRAAATPACCLITMVVWHAAITHRHTVAVCINGLCCLAGCCATPTSCYVAQNTA